MINENYRFEIVLELLNKVLLKNKNNLKYKKKHNLR